MCEKSTEIITMWRTYTLGYRKDWQKFVLSGLHGQYWHGSVNQAGCGTIQDGVMQSKARKSTVHVTRSSVPTPKNPRDAFLPPHPQQESTNAFERCRAHLRARKCSCGIYGYKSFDLLCTYESPYTSAYSGVIRVVTSSVVWGVVYEYTLGYRVEYSEIIAMWLPPVNPMYIADNSSLYAEITQRNSSALSNVPIDPTALIANLSHQFNIPVNIGVPEQD